MLSCSVFACLFQLLNQLPASKEDMQEPGITTNVCPYLFCHSFSHTSCRQNNTYEKWGLLHVNGFDIKIIVKSNGIKKNQILGVLIFHETLPFGS